MKILLAYESSLVLEHLEEYLGGMKIPVVRSGVANFDLIKEMIDKEGVTHVICDTKKSYGKNLYSTSFIESRLSLNVSRNLYLPLLLANECNKTGVHFTYIGDGCVFKRNKDGDIVDLEVSSHAIVNNYCEKLLTKTTNVLYLRFRYPISGTYDPRCYLTKLSTFDGILRTNNSVSILEPLFPIMIRLIEKGESGIYNMFGETPANSIDLALRCKYELDSNMSIKEIDETTHNELVGERSNIVMEPTALKQFCSEEDIKPCNTEEGIRSVLSNMGATCTELKRCLCCRGPVSTVIDLGYQPLANDFHIKNSVCKIYPLRLMHCPKCFHCQLSHSIDPVILFKNYKYVSGTSQTGNAFFKENAELIHRYKGGSGKVLDIACNDGTQLNYFKELGWETFGVDPAENICPMAEKEGHSIICSFWNDSCAERLPTMDVITAQNVFAHTPSVDEFLQTCKKVMDDNTSLFIQTSQRDMIINGEFDTTYHEHLSFFSTSSMRTLTERNGLVLNRVMEHSIHGRSYIFEIKLGKDEKIYDVDKHLEVESKCGLYDLVTYGRFKLNAERSVSVLKTYTKSYREKGYKVIGFGAAAKGQTLICYGNIDLEYIIDENPLKIGCYSPKLDIPIVSLDHFREDRDEKILVVILAWNFAEEIKRKITAAKGNKKIVIIEKYFPEIVIS